ncbi:hypothetical protein GXP67_32840 [Rhodocytophaga rosea]|uniref:Uncharacterized protein n=1 Tax=Rhodocytophaga rosea TaxID=2704465 RepID=A0A6C0GU81_9BACT|nr:hypothetical protein [Rhodocytophaga rosea]QHT71103.1 hypothetical protein GXP67_32840 [Rhodocytophaga rosea]
MRQLVDEAILKIKTEHPSYIIYTASIWTDAESAASAVNFDSEESSIQKVAKSNEWNKKHYERLLNEGNIDQAQLYLPEEGRNTNPADFELRDYVELDNKSFQINWESETDGECWDILEHELKEIGEYAFVKIKQLNIHADFELAVNGRQDWYEFTWRVD